MATSFAAYASQYLTRQQHAGASVASSQPMFFSFTTDDDGSRHGGHDTDLDDMDDPHLNMSMGASTSAAASGHHKQQQDDEDDPYLRLDEDEHLAGPSGSRTLFRQQHEQSIPLMARPPSPASPPGWLAHLARSPPRRASPSPSPPSSSAEDDSDSSPPMDLLVASPQGHPRAPTKSHRLGNSSASRPPSIPPPPPQTGAGPQSLSVSLTESLLPRDGASHAPFTFSLPDPRHTPRKRRKYHDSIWTSLFLFLLSTCLLLSVLVLFLTERPKGVPAVMLPYAIMLRTVPILVILTCVSAVLAYTHVYLLRLFVGPVMIATEVFVPATLFVCAVWAFVGSFMWEAGVEPTWGETVGLRLFSLIPLLLSLLTARRLLNLPHQIHRTSSLLTLSTHILLANPFLLALSPLLLILMLVLSIPFITLVFRLLLIGYTTGVRERGTLEWHVRAWADWAIVLVLGVWFWCWAVARGVLRTTAAGVVGAWYFSDPTLPPPPPTSTHTLHAALTRSTGPSLGSIILASLILTLLRLLALLILLLNRLPPLLLRIPYVPVGMYVVPGVRVLVAWLEGVGERVSGYALVLVGLGGAGFWDAAGWGVGLVRGRGGQVGGRGQGQGQGGRRMTGRGNQSQPSHRQPNPNRTLLKTGFLTEPPLTLLTISPLTLTLPASLLVYLFVAHTLRAPHEALGAALLAGGMTAVVGLFCTGLVRDVVDALWVCWVFDLQEGGQGVGGVGGVRGERRTRREEVGVVFGDGDGNYDSATETSGAVLPLHHGHDRREIPPPPLSQPAARGLGKGNRHQQQPQAQTQPRAVPPHPETIIPRSPLARRGEQGVGGGGGGGVKGLEASVVGANVLFDAGDDEERERESQQRQQHHPAAAPYAIGEDSDGELDSASGLEGEGGLGGARVVQVPGRGGGGGDQHPYAQRQHQHQQQDEEGDEEDPLDPFKSSRHVDEEALLGFESAGRRVGAGAGSGSGSAPRSAGTSPIGTGAGATPTTATMGMGMGVRQGTGFANVNVNVNRANIGFGAGGGAGAGAGAEGGMKKGISISPGAFGGFAGVGGVHGHVRSTSGGQQLQQYQHSQHEKSQHHQSQQYQHQQRTLSTSQEMNMKSQFLMGMGVHGSGSGGSGGSGSGGSVDGSRVSERGGGGEREQEEEGGEEGSVLGPGSDFFN